VEQADYVTSLSVSGSQAAHSRGMAAAARIGLVARGIVYLLMGWLAIKIATGHRNQQANQKGALADVASHSGGLVLLIALAGGFAAYASWQLTQAIYGTAADGRKTSARLTSLVRCLGYAALCATAISVLTGSSKTGQAQQQAGLTARLMHHTGGRWLVGAIGLVVVIVGVAMMVDGLRRTFVKQLQITHMERNTRRTVEALGVVGSTARGIVVALAGALIIDAAATADPSKSTGLDGALRTLVHQAYGPWLLGSAALGLIAFGIYGLAAAKWARV
jgi:hypothetical protein